MANEFDLDQLIDKVNEENGLNKKLSAFDDDFSAEEKSENTEAVTSEEPKKMSKADMAKMIAARLSQDDDEDEMPVAPVRTATAERTERPAPKRESFRDFEYDDDDDYELPKIKEKPEKSEKKKKAKKEKSGPSTLGLVLGFFGGLVIVAVLAFYVGGLVMTSGKFLPGTTINGQDVSMMSAAQVAKLFEEENQVSDLVFYKNDGSYVEIPLSSIGYEVHTTEKVQELLDEKNSAMWFTSLVSPKSYKVDVNAATYDENKLKRELSYADWGDKEPVDAYIASSSNGFIIISEEDGHKVDVDKLFEYAKEQIAEGNTDIKVSGASEVVKAEVVSADLQTELERMNSIANLVITIDFDYTQEQLTGNDVAKWITYNDDGTYTVDRDKVMGYVEALADKYDTYNTKRKFNATLQGEIVVPISADARYGWWIYQDETADLLCKLIEEGKSVTTDPIYYYDTNADGTKGYVYTGVEEARTAEDDIGDTYVEIDLTAQTLWHYVDGEMVYTCGIVSGQPTPSVRKTLPGVYKVWYKARNYTMKSSNSAGESWEVECAYWTRVAIVGIGLHDSQWRGNNVGGDIYKTNGSHGCINMTLKGAKYIYENVDYGTPVVMYY